MTDEEILAVCNNFDRYFGELLDVTQADVPYMSSILLARLMLANDFAGTGENFRDTLQRAIEIKPDVHGEMTRH